MKVAQDKSLRPQHGAVKFASPRSAQSGLSAPQLDQITMQGKRLRVHFSLGEIQFTALECRGIGGIGELHLYLWQGNAGKLLQELRPAFADGLR